MIIQNEFLTKTWVAAIAAPYDSVQGWILGVRCSVFEWNIPLLHKHIKGIHSIYTSMFAITHLSGMFQPWDPPMGIGNWTRFNGTPFYWVYISN